jgi:single-strand DNA-binding protein
MKVTVDIIGRLTKDPQTKENSNVTILSVVVNRKRNGVEMTDYFNCFVYGKTAEIAQKYLKKGRLVSLGGELNFDTFNDKHQNKISVSTLTLIDSGRDTETATQQPARRANTQSARQTAPASKTNPQPASRPAPPTPDPVFLSDDEDDDQQDDDDNSIPF